MKLLKQFGGRVTEELEARYRQSPNWKGSDFKNYEHTYVQFTWNSVPKIIRDQYNNGRSRKPKTKLPVLPFDHAAFSAAPDKPKFVWYGHSALLLQINGKNLLIDPMLGDDTTPIAPFSNRRFSEKVLDMVDDFPKIDAILLTHDHYDHLDYDSIQKLKPKVDTYFVALGLGRHLQSWDIPKEQITELDWWDSLDFEGINITFTPSRHFSGRGLRDRAKCLWGGWVFRTEQHQIYWSGDGGYGKHFAEVQRRFGAFDWAFMECGQYNDNWKLIHMLPEEAARAAKEVQTQVAIPVHWGGFTLAFHPWKEPVERFLAEAQEIGQKTCTPSLGAVVTMGEAPVDNRWFDSYD